MICFFTLFWTFIFVFFIDLLLNFFVDLFWTFFVELFLNLFCWSICRTFFVELFRTCFGPLFLKFCELFLEPLLNFLFVRFWTFFIELYLLNFLLELFSLQFRPSKHQVLRSLWWVQYNNHISSFRKFKSEFANRRNSSRRVRGRNNRAFRFFIIFS